MLKRKSYATKDESPQKQIGFLRRVRQRLNKGESWLTRDIADIVPGGKIDDAVMEELDSGEDGDGVAGKSGPRRADGGALRGG